MTKLDQGISHDVSSILVKEKTMKVGDELPHGGYLMSSRFLVCLAFYEAISNFCWWMCFSLRIVTLQENDRYICTSWSLIWHLGQVVIWFYASIITWIIGPWVVYKFMSLFFVTNVMVNHLWGYDCILMTTFFVDFPSHVGFNLVLYKVIYNFIDFFQGFFVSLNVVMGEKRCGQ